jgi:hypothetical protein
MDSARMKPQPQLRILSMSILISSQAKPQSFRSTVISLAVTRQKMELYFIPRVS